ncbi:MAG: ABC transporter permease [Methanomassiliicoccales archaeon]
MASRVLVDFKASLKMFYRSKSAIFWTLAFPIILMFIFGAIFSGMGEATYTLHVQDMDGSQTSGEFVQALNGSGALDVVQVDPGVDTDRYIKDNSLSSFLVIPEGFQQAVASGSNVTLDLRLDQTSSSAGVVGNVVDGVSGAWNMDIAHASPVIQVEVESIIREDYSFIDFFLPGVIGLMIMTSAVNDMVSMNTRYRNAGMFSKFLTTPFTRMEFLVSRIMRQLVITALSVGVIMLIGVGVFGVAVTLGPVSIALLVLGSFMFSALGMILARFIKEEESADAAANAVVFPMMFLAGTFFPLESMPGYLQAVAQVLPLTYLNEGLRDSMIYGNTEGALVNLAVVAVLALVMMVVGAYITKWKSE